MGHKLLDLDSYKETAHKTFELADQISADRIELDFLDLGGGLGVSYDSDIHPSPRRINILSRR